MRPRSDLDRIDAVLEELRKLWAEAPETEREYIMVRINHWLDERNSAVQPT